ncbi:hypothetical protein ElyMa_000277500 [Elysia marginata]|uniref:Uncharacterized protein n=1 Tax=Elysia marginata TaxID=1093978 RepID=A0AAV4F5X6_9GAST|nr:hypothetical protein ElyMa_000277500 [Elysia marginata]
MATQLVQYMDLRLTIDNNPPAYEFGPGHIRPTHAPHTNYLRQTTDTPSDAPRYLDLDSEASQQASRQSSKQVSGFQESY